MIEIELPLFGKKILKKEDWEYKYEARLWKYNFDGKVIDLDVHFKKINEQNVSKVSLALNDLHEIYKIGQTAYLRDFEQGTTVKEYIKEWNEDIFLQIFDKQGFQQFIEKTDKKKTIEQRLLSLIRLVRIGVYAESENTFVTMDYAFGYGDEHGFREDMIVVTLNPNYEVTDICTEG